ncbi:hypothetical protein BDV59DRAFT_186509 [Aspergillus ambiguus]|uniref:uncharacterized protein n=1 Tax=Aspergillus ambiguus TaxID=176160 RepID=UPI003CCD5148
MVAWKTSGQTGEHASSGFSPCASRSALTISSCPRPTARERAVWPSASDTAVMSHPASMRSFTTSVCPASTASCRRVPERAGFRDTIGFTFKTRDT